MAIFGNKKYLRPDKDDDKLLQLLEADTSDLENLDEDSEDNISGLNKELAAEEHDENDIGTAESQIRYRTRRSTRK